MIRICFGDSNTNQTSVSSSEKWTYLLQTHYGDTVINEGTDGNDTNEAKMRFNKDVLSQNPNVVYMMFGTNDQHMRDLDNDGLIEPDVDLTTFRNNLQYFVDEIKSIGATPILMTCIPIVDSLYFKSDLFNSVDYEQFGGADKHLEMYNDVTRELALENNIALVDNYKVFISEAGVLTTDTQTEKEDKLMASGLYFGDGVHMNATGSVVVKENIITTQQPTQTISALKFFGYGKAEAIKVYQLDQITNKSLRVFLDGKVQCLNLVDATDVSASNMRIYINDSIKAVEKLI